MVDQLFRGLLLKPALISFLIAFISTPFVIQLAKYFNLVDDPKKRIHPAHTHQGIIPRAGGLAIFFGIFITSLIFFPFSKQLIGILSGATILVIVGLLDDKYDLNPYFRFITNFLAAVLVVLSGIGIPYITNPFGGIIYLDTWQIKFNLLGLHSLVVWQDLFALFWIVWCLNMVNWSKGVDGQMPGFVAIAAIVIGILSFRFIKSGDLTQWIPSTLAFITAGAFLGFLPFNFYPQKIMPGYSGGSLAGYMLAVLAILSSAKVGTAILVLGVPLIDAVYAIIRRLTRGQSPFWGDREHFHHRLLDLGWGRRKIAFFYWLVSAILGVIALTVTAKVKLFIFIFLGVIIGGLILWFKTLRSWPKP